MTAPLQIKLLGSPQLLLDGQPLPDFAYQKSLALLSYLLVTQKPQPRSSLATLLWGESTEANARAQLRTALAELRQRLEPYLEITRNTVAFNRDSSYWLDVEAFTAACAAETGGRSELDALKTAVELYRGDFLAGFQVRNALDFEQWQVEQQEWLHKLAEQALETLVEDGLTRSAHREGLEYANRLLALTPWHEPGHRQKMRLLALNGQRSEALAQYRRCVEILAEQFIADPSPETLALYEEIKAGKLTAQKPPATVPPHNLPAPLVTFIGREKELNEVVTLLLDPERRFITLVGEGGVGKTHLAQVAARQVVPHFRDGVWFVPLLNLPAASATSPEILPTLLATAVAAALKITFYGPDSPPTQLFNRLRPKQLLLILDNFEHLATGAEFVLDLLKNAPQVTVLVTSRARLKFQAEYALRLAGLPLPPTNDDPAAAAYDSVQLFADRARRSWSGFVLDAGTLPQVAHLCRLVEGLPLGIELVAAWVEHLPLAEIIANLQQDLAAVTALHQDVPEQHHGLRLVFESSWRLLSGAEQMMLAALSVFRGDFSRNAALTATGAELAHLMALGDKSLLKTTYPGRYLLHELLRQFAAEKLAVLLPAAAAAEVSERHSTYYLTLLTEQVDLLAANNPQPALEALEAEMSNIRQAWEWGIQWLGQAEWGRSHPMLLARSIKGLARFYDFKGLYQTGEHLFRTAGDRLRASTPPAAEAGAAQTLLAMVLGAQGQFLLVLGQFTQAVTLLREVLSLTESLEPADEIQAGKVVFLKHLGDAYTGLSDYRSADDAYTRSLDLARELADQAGAAAARLALAWVSLNRGDFAQAETLAQEALALYRDLDNQKNIALTFNTLGTIAVKTNQYAQAQTHYQQSLDIRRRLNHPREIAESLNNLGTVASELGQFDRAKQCYQECLALVRPSGNRPAIANILNNLGSLAGMQTRYPEAQQYFEQSLQIRQEMGDQYGIATSLNNLAATARYLEDYETARRYAEESLALYIEIAHRPGSVFCLDNLGYITAAQGQWAAAWRYFQMALQESLAIKAIVLTLDALAGMSGLFVQAGDYSRAAHLLGLALSHPQVSSTTTHNAQAILAQLRQVWPEEKLQAEMAHGQTLDWQKEVLALGSLGRKWVKSKP